MDNEQDRLLQYEESLFAKGFLRIAGVDEAGRGPLAGPVFAAACVIPRGLFFQGINDSKKLSSSEREGLFDQLTHHPDVFYGIGRADVALIDQINILQATFFAMRQAIEQLSLPPDYVLIDGSLLPKPFPYRAQAVVRGDAQSQSIAAASILAKVTRDAWMKEEDLRYPGYGFARHFGYGTPTHKTAIQTLGACPIHRKSFAPFRKQLI
ncbi:MAG: ribonuclease HII [Simkania sp.]|nr:ribonuclease HII [Simkania sp.]